MNLLFTICGRAGSKGVKNKNIRKFNNYPLLFHTISACSLFRERYGKLYNRIDLALNTDSQELVDQMESLKVEYTYIERLPDLSGDRVSKPAVIKDTLIKTENKNACQYDIIVDLDLTSPLRTVDDIRGVITTLIEKEADVSFSVARSRRLPSFNMVTEKENGYYDIIVSSNYVSRQEASVCYDMNASIYAYRRQFITNEKTRRVFDGKTVIWEMMDTGILDIDNEGDLEMMEVIGRYIIDKYKGYKEVYEGIKKLMIII